MIDTKIWGKFTISDIFYVINGKGLTIEEIEENTGDIPCVQGGASNNGSIGKIDEEYCKKKKYCIVDEPCLTVARVGTSGYVNYWDTKCAIGDKCKALVFKEHRNPICYLYLQTILQKLTYKYSYGRGLSTATYSSEVIKLPVSIDGTPDWDYMEAYMGGVLQRTIKDINQKFAQIAGS